MKFFLLSAFFVILTIGLKAQQVHFAYLQTDSHKPFYVLLNKKSHSSSSIGYIILPKLPNGDYSIKIGFPKSELPEQDFLLQVKDNDQGFLIKDFGEKGYGLFNLQTLNVQYAGESQKIRLQAEEEKRKQELAVAEKRRNDSLQQVAVVQKRYEDSITAVQAALAQQRYDDSVQQAAVAAGNQARMQQEEEMEKGRKAAAEAAAIRKKNEEDSLQQARRVETDRLQQEAAAARDAENIRKKNEADSQKRIQLEAEAAQNRKMVQMQKTADSLAAIKAAALEKQRNDTITGGSNQPVPVINTENPTPSLNTPVLVNKIFTDSGWRYIYTVRNNNRKENIDVFIPVSNLQNPVVATIVEMPKEPVLPPKETADTTIIVAEPPAKEKKPKKIVPEIVEAPQPEEPAKDSVAFLNFSINDTAASNKFGNTDNEKQLPNSNCQATATEKDFLNARKKIAATEGTEKMITLSRKLMKEKCFSTDQIRNLSFLFLTDADRYQFLDAAYPFASDAYRYHTLSDVLKDEYYLQRFRAMLR